MKNWVRRDSQRRRQDVLLLDTRCGRKIQLCLFLGILTFYARRLFSCLHHMIVLVSSFWCLLSLMHSLKERMHGVFIVSHNFKARRRGGGHGAVGTWGCRDVGQSVMNIFEYLNVPL